MTGLVILEGPDGTGKTTLGRELVSRYAGRYVHLTRYKTRKRLFRMWWATVWLAQEESKKRLVVIDRHWLSHQIYQPIYGGEVMDHEAEMADWALKQLNAVNVMCWDTPQRILARHQKRASEGGEMYQTDDRFKAVVNRYNLSIFGDHHTHVGYNLYLDRIIAKGGMEQRADTIVHCFGDPITDVEDFIIRRNKNAH